MVSAAVKSGRFGSAVKEGWNAQDGCGYYEHHGGTIGFCQSQRCPGGRGW